MIPKVFLDSVDILTESEITPKNEKECEKALHYFYECLSDHFYTSQDLKDFINRVSKKFTETL